MRGSLLGVSTACTMLAELGRTPRSQPGRCCPRSLLGRGRHPHSLLPQGPLWGYLPSPGSAPCSPGTPNLDSLLLQSQNPRAS